MELERYRPDGNRNDELHSEVREIEQRNERNNATQLCGICRSAVFMRGSFGFLKHLGDKLTDDEFRTAYWAQRSQKKIRCNATNVHFLHNGPRGKQYA
jgi:hypothetical protein